MSGLDGLGWPNPKDEPAQTNRTESMTKPTKYRCNKCGKTVLRESEKKWIPSYCDTTAKRARIYRVEKMPATKSNHSKQ